MKENTQIKIDFNKDISRVMDLIMKGEEIQARHIFNTEIYEKYKKFMVPNNVIYFAIEFWTILNEYLNDKNVRILKQKSSEKDFLLAIYEDYQNDYKNSD